MWYKLLIIIPLLQGVEFRPFMRYLGDDLLSKQPLQQAGQIRCKSKLMWHQLVSSSLLMETNSISITSKKGETAPICTVVQSKPQNKARGWTQRATYHEPP